ncbi:MAG: histone deacetylase [Rhodothermus sp.]|nr:histone deacetylase [Rhodothermus sp.]
MTTAFAWNPSHESHYEVGHVERPERLAVIQQRLLSLPIWNRLQHTEPLPVDLGVARLVHRPTYLERLQQALQRAPTRLDPDTYVQPASLAVALEAVGALLAVARTVLEGHADNGFAAIRPPGHHATPERAMGFCLLSNVAIAVRWVQQTFGVERVAIVDFDVHHGNGTQEVFYEDPNVLFLSVHQFPHYPGTGRMEEIGAGRGRGTTVNVPLPAYTGDDGCLEAFRRLLGPVVRRFRPEVLFVSAGYDAHWRDPLSAMQLTVTGYAQLVYELMEWADACCDNRLIMTLEGGYDTEALAASITASITRLLDPMADIEDPIGPAPHETTDVRDLIYELRLLHKVA